MDTIPNQNPNEEIIRLSMELQKEKQKNLKSKKRIEELHEILKVTNKTLRHDILNHLATVSMALEIYEKKKDEKYIKSAFKGVHRGVDLIKQMKELEPLIEFGPEPRPINIREIIDSVMPSYKIDYSINGDCQVLASQAIIVVIGNIVGNAIKHGNTDRIDFKLVNNEKSCEIIISDYGIGIPLDLRERLFDAGFSNGENRGTGLGLYIAKKFIELYGGNIRVQDNLPQGTTFVITLERAF
jgi:signal transduction histidine kinase